MEIKLNQRQLEAVNKTSGPLLIIAGAGSGKTRTLVERTAGIIKSGLASPWEIMAVTFTNKAAKELTERIVQRREKPEKAFLPELFIRSAQDTEKALRKTGLQTQFRHLRLRRLGQSAQTGNKKQ
jgi:superfamily I DNA/RNA helicase